MLLVRKRLPPTASPTAAPATTATTSDRIQDWAVSATAVQKVLVPAIVHSALMLAYAVGNAPARTGGPLPAEQGDEDRRHPQRQQRARVGGRGRPNAGGAGRCTGLRSGRERCSVHLP